MKMFLYQAGAGGDGGERSWFDDDVTTFCQERRMTRQD